MTITHKNKQSFIVGRHATAGEQLLGVHRHGVRPLQMFECGLGQRPNHGTADKQARQVVDKIFREKNNLKSHYILGEWQEDITQFLKT